MANPVAPRPRLLPGRDFPPYAYLPGRYPHPVRDPAGHSYHGGPAQVADSEPLKWGIDLFNHGYYWEAHEAWEALWQAAGRLDPDRLLIKGLILLAAAGVKIREGKPVAAARHAGRAASLFHRVARQPGPTREEPLAMSPVMLTRYADHAIHAASILRAPTLRRAEPVFGFVLGLPETAV